MTQSGHNVRKHANKDNGMTAVVYANIDYLG